MSNKNKCPLIERGLPQQPASIQTTGTATEEQLPEKGRVDVYIRTDGPNRDEVWNKFQELIKELLAVIGESGSPGRIEPYEESSFDESKERGGREVLTVSATIKIDFEIENLGAVIAALVQHNFMYSNVSFTFSEKITISPALLEEASKNARDNAEAVARGAGQTIGRLVSIYIGAPPMNEYKPLDEPFLALRTLSHSSIDTALFNAKISDLKARVITATVTATFEIVE